ncbi:Protein kinase protein with adenine nucleotide alpha hydrolase-like domain [Forsythia ovata]|uniref:RING-type E3 ubiquitin transferase n=1 Tax=Forsythia ovata TaxID=205694 RepID=A0ABD1X063_9LAMI
MWQSNAKGSIARRGVGNGLVAVAIDKDKGSQYAIRWTIDNLLTRGQTIILIHVVKRASSSLGKNYYVHDLNGAASAHKEIVEKHTTDLFLTFHCFCTRKDIRCLDVVLEDTDVARAMTDYVTYFAIDNLVLGASRHGFIRRLKMVDLPSSVSKGAPDFCTVYVISKSKISSVRNACRPAPFASPLYKQIRQLQEANSNGFSPDGRPRRIPSMRVGEMTPRKAPGMLGDNELAKSPFARGRAFNGKSNADFLELDTDISFISSGRPSIDIASTMLCDSTDSCRTSRVSTSSESSLGSARSGAKDGESKPFTDFSSSSLQNDDVESEMRRLKLELQRTMEMYSTACKEALTSKQKAVELNHWRMEEERRLEEARLAEEEAKMVAEEDKAKCRAAIENAEAAQRIAEIESQKRVSAELEAIKESDETQTELNPLAQQDLIYRRYTIEEIEEATEYFSESRKIGEGGYGPVFKCHLDHTPVAVKILRPDAAQGKSQFQHEVEVLTCMRHPNMVILLGACPEYGCLIYEYMANGSLEDCLFRRGNMRPLSWQLRFRIAAEIATALLFLHQTKPEPLVHRDLKPGNILLDHNFVSKIGDVGLARLVPPSVANEVTQYRMTSAAGTFCYIDPEYQQTGMLGVKSDVYSFGIVLLQLLSGKPAMGLTHHVGRSIEKGTFEEILDPAVPDWPVEEALNFAKLSLQCAELRRKDRPDLGKVILPELNRLRELGEESMSHFLVGGNATPSPNHSHASITQEMMSDPQVHSGYNNSASLPK